MEIHIFPYLENNLKVILLSISSLFLVLQSEGLKCIWVVLMSFAVLKKTLCHKRICEILNLWGLHRVEDCNGVQQLWVDWRVHFHQRSSTWPNCVCTSSQSNVTFGITTRPSPARRAAALSCKRQSLVQSDSCSSFSWWPRVLGEMVPQEGQMSSKWESQTRRRSAPGDVSCGWETELGREAGTKSGRRWQKVGQRAVWFGEKETEVENRSSVERLLGRQRTGMETCCLHREGCLQRALFQN